MLRDKINDQSSTYAYAWNVTKYQHSAKYTFLVSYAGKTASVDKYLINVCDWYVVEYVDKEVIKEVPVIKYIERYNDIVEYKNQTQYNYIERDNSTELFICGVVCFVIGGLIGWRFKK